MPCGRGSASRTGARQRSPSLSADGRHLVTDVVSTLGVLLGVLLAIATGYAKLDAILAALVGVTILWSGWRLIRESVIGLMDVAVDPKTLRQIREIIAANAEGAIEAHDIRTRQAGKMTFIEFHLVVPGSMSVEAAHAICDHIEAKLREGGGGCADHHPCRARGQGQAFGDRGALGRELIALNAIRSGNRLI